VTSYSYLSPNAIENSKLHNSEIENVCALIAFKEKFCVGINAGKKTLIIRLSKMILIARSWLWWVDYVLKVSLRTITSVWIWLIFKLFKIAYKNKWTFIIIYKFLLTNIIVSI
jgi:hypothetical protein